MEEKEVFFLLRKFVIKTLKLRTFRPIASLVAHAVQFKIRWNSHIFLEILMTRKYGSIKQDECSATAYLSTFVRVKEYLIG